MKLIPQGQVFGRLTVIRQADSRIAKSGRVVCAYLCKCFCGKEKIVDAGCLRNGNTRSCGCYKLDKLIERSSTHGLSDHPMAITFHAMLQRCYNPKSDSWISYGGKVPTPITICSEWLNDRSQFFCDMLPTWSEGMTIERIDINGPYSKENCKWLPKNKQQRNRSTSRIVSLDGRLMCMAEAADTIGMDKPALKRKLNKSNGQPIQVEGHCIQDTSPIRRVTGGGIVEAMSYWNSKNLVLLQISPAS